MPKRVQNLTRNPVHVPLTTGSTLRLSPGQTSDELQDVELMNNPMVDKLKGRNVIAVEDVGQETSTSRKASSARGKSGPPAPSSAAGQSVAESEGPAPAADEAASDEGDRSARGKKRAG
jgi:hypothetical protein